MDAGIAVPLTGLLTLGATQLFVAQAPKLGELRATDPDDDAVRGVLRVAEVQAAGVAVLAGLTIAMMSGQSAPLWLAMASAALTIGVYEWALAH
jgi:hypothetical protein